MKILKNLAILTCLLLVSEIFYGQEKVDKKNDIAFERNVKLLNEQKRLGDELVALQHNSKMLDKQKKEIQSAEKVIEKRNQTIKKAENSIEKTKKQIAKKQQKYEVFKRTINTSNSDPEKLYKIEIESKEFEVQILKLQTKLVKQQKELDTIVDNK